MYRVLFPMNEDINEMNLPTYDSAFNCANQYDDPDVPIVIKSQNGVTISICLQGLWVTYH